MFLQFTVRCELSGGLWGDIPPIGNPRGRPPWMKSWRNVPPFEKTSPTGNFHNPPLCELSMNLACAFGGYRVQTSISRLLFYRGAKSKTTCLYSILFVFFVLILVLNTTIDLDLNLVFWAYFCSLVLVYLFRVLYVFFLINILGSTSNSYFGLFFMWSFLIFLFFLAFFILTFLY